MLLPRDLHHARERLVSRPPCAGARLFACVVITLSVGGCSRATPGRAAGNAAAAPRDSTGPASDFVLREDVRGVATAAVQATSLSDYVDVPARIAADPTRVVRVYAPLSGRLIAVHVRPSDAVQEGQVLAVLASSDVAVARAAYRQAQADAQVKQQSLERSKLLYENHVVALREYQQAQADARSAAAALESAVERLQLLTVDTAGSSDQVTVTAPRAGVIIDLGAAPGEYAKSLDNQNPLCVIADLRRVWAVGGVYEKDLASVLVGAAAEVTVNAYPNDMRRGRVTALSSTIDTTTRALKIRVELDNPGLRLKPDMFATIRIVRAVHAAVLVPAAAVLREGTSAFLFVQTSPGHFERRTVSLGREVDGNRVEVTAGLVPGDTVVVEGAELLRAAGRRTVTLGRGRARDPA
jgi:cobalt-zinc-cadmium efflux system membrane fusion protein